MFDYDLSKQSKERVSLTWLFRQLYKYLKGSRVSILVAFFFLAVSSATTVIAPFMTGDITNKYVPSGDKDNLIKWTMVLGGIYLVGVVSSYFQIYIMGKVGQSTLFRIRNAIFEKIQSLPLQFFNQNKSGDLISRINNDTEKLSQSFSETLLRFTGDIVVIVSIGLVMVGLEPTLGTIAWITLGIMLLLTWMLSGWIKSRNDNSLQKLGEMSAEIQESLSNFRVIVVFNRRAYLKESFKVVNDKNRRAATWAGIANGILAPIYSYAGSIASLLILILGIQILIFDKLAIGAMPEFGSLLTFILYSNSFFGPLREMGDLFAQLQTGIASWTRINRILKLESNLKQLDIKDEEFGNTLMKFDNVSFGYSKESMVLNKINIDLEPGKTYALVGPTGGGKSTTASLMARLYDVTEGQVFFKGKDIRSYDRQELANDIGFILQEPFLFTGTLLENIKYGNKLLEGYSESEMTTKLNELGLEKLIARFDDGLNTEIKPGSENISLGQKQLVAFVRILLREPKLLILDEATANIDTVTEQILEDILSKLPATTTKVIIAHRLNTIESADQIFFISGGMVEKPIDFDSAMGLINMARRTS